jgi:hypothetical protein
VAHLDYKKIKEKLKAIIQDFKIRNPPLTTGSSRVLSAQDQAIARLIGILEVCWFKFADHLCLSLDAIPCYLSSVFFFILDSQASKIIEISSPGGAGGR